MFLTFHKENQIIAVDLFRMQDEKLFCNFIDDCVILFDFS